MVVLEKFALAKNRVLTNQQLFIWIRIPVRAVPPLLSTFNSTSISVDS